MYTVEIFPVEKCSCLIPHAACSHVLAVKTALRMNDSSKAFATTNIGLVRTKARGKAKSGRKQPRPGDIKISERDDEPVITIQPTTDQDVEDTTESDSEAIVKEVRKSIESNIKQIGTNLSADAIGRIKGDIDNGWLDDSVIDCARNLIHSQFPK